MARRIPHPLMLVLALSWIVLPGCAYFKPEQRNVAPAVQPATVQSDGVAVGASVSGAEPHQESSPPAIEQASLQQELELQQDEVPKEQLQEEVPKAELVPPRLAPADKSTLAVSDVVASIHATFPLLDAAYQELAIANGKRTAAWGRFDTKLKASGESGALGFYETYRNSAGFTQPIYRGGEVFSKYRAGRGSFQPWYLERQTNDAGEFSTGIRVPLARNREIDARRAELWRATYEQQRAEPEVRAALIQFVRDGSVAYWEWLAAGQRYKIGESALKLAEQRNAQLKRRVDAGDLDPPVLQDNLRAIAKRQSDLIDLQRKVTQASLKLSLFYRTNAGEPLLPETSQLTDFPKPADIKPEELQGDLAVALAERPEFAILDALSRQANVDLAEGRNDLLPSVDAQLVGSQDVGEPTSSKRDKSEFELEAGIFVDVPLQRRKARGKIQAAQGKLTQLAAKRQFTVDKVRVEVESSRAAVTAAFNRLGRAQESRRLAEYMADVERRKFDLGQSDLLAVFLREQSAIEAAEAEVKALLEYFSARANLNAAIGRDWP